MSFSSPQKNIARTAMAPRNRPKNLVIFPGPDLEFHGLDNRNSRLICFERKLAIADKIRQHLQQRGLREGKNFVLLEKDAEKVDLQAASGWKPIDYAFFDFCGPITVSICNWLLQYETVFQDGAEIALTFSRPRNNLLTTTVGDFAKQLIDEEVDWPKVNRPLGLGVKTTIDKAPIYMRATFGAMYALMSSVGKITLTDCVYYKSVDKRLACVSCKFTLHNRKCNHAYRNWFIALLDSVTLGKPLSRQERAWHHYNPTGIRAAA